MKNKEESFVTRKRNKEEYPEIQDMGYPAMPDMMSGYGMGMYCYCRPYPMYDHGCGMPCPGSYMGDMGAFYPDMESPYGYEPGYYDPGYGPGYGYAPGMNPDCPYRDRWSMNPNYPMAEDEE